MRSVSGGLQLRVVATLLVGALVAAACGSTVQERDQLADVAVDEFSAEAEDRPGEGQVLARDGVDEAGREELDGPIPPDAQPESPDGPSTPADDDGRPASPGRQREPVDGQQGQVPAAAAGGGWIPAGADVPGVTDDTIHVGMVNIDLGTAADVNSALGGGDAYEDTMSREIGEALAAHINERGGIAGRQLKIVWHDTDTVSLVRGEGRGRDAQRACATWTEDNEIFAFMDRTLVSDVFLGCARRNNVVMVPQHVGFAVDEQIFGTMPHLWYSGNRMIAERRDKNLVENLVRRGVLTSDSRVGIVVEDWEGARRGVTNGMEPALAAHGIEVVAKAVYPDIIESPWDTYILQFRSADVTHVLFAQFWDAQGWAALFMMRAAENQVWRPTWGIASDNRPMRLAQGGAPRAQMANTVGMGWQPQVDVGRYDETEARSRCSQIAGRPLSHVGDDFWHTYCDLLFFLQAALERAPEVSPAGMAAGVEALGDQYQAIEATSGRTRFGRGRHDGTALQRDLVYNEGCTDDGIDCWRYSSAPGAMP